jgi:hypothetical protein
LNYELLKFKCGGWRRPWDSVIISDHPADGYAFTFSTAKRQSAITKFYKNSAASSCCLQVGSHGQRVNAVRWTYLAPPTSHLSIPLKKTHIEGSSFLLASGSEDTTIKIFQYADNGELNVLFTLTDPVSSIQAMRWSSHPLRTPLLFTCGGKRHLFAHQLYYNECRETTTTNHVRVR